VLSCLASRWTRSLVLLKHLRYPLKKGLSHGLTVFNLLRMHSRATLSKVSVKARDVTSISSLLKHSFQLHSLKFLRRRSKSANSYCHIKRWHALGRFTLNLILPLTVWWSLYDTALVAATSDTKSSQLVII